ncbi:MAG: glycine cleavage system protein R [Desulfobacteraceae bacterium]
MEKVVISVLGTDRPGIVAAVSGILHRLQCNVEDVSQSILQGEFAAIFIALVPQGSTPEQIRQHLREELAPMGLQVLLKAFRPGSRDQAPPAGAEPFVVVTSGPDRLGLVAGITEVMARFNVNITHLKAAFRGGEDPQQNTMIYEVDVPPFIDRAAFRHALKKRARELGLLLSLQHRDIFEAINRI